MGALVLHLGDCHQRHASIDIIIISFSTLSTLGLYQSILSPSIHISPIQFLDSSQPGQLGLIIIIQPRAQIILPNLSASTSSHFNSLLINTRLACARFIPPINQAALICLELSRTSSFHSIIQFSHTESTIHLSLPPKEDSSFSPRRDPSHYLPHSTSF
ncbi:hypothetical protein MJO28_013636 [Puccinia striiformis f. sp. tritici]|uniref:Uncharacterized protein n=1 Tax=Puccinia striiformis f. sp. tritici TaxID=168172 RepID=A0ACC0DVB5_9BASI|nr:hypothetical protein MJO28_013636 [Puccinia striiformis f. sp. tritici]KAI7941403.1 hypothetical protein MJO29_013477 [Puccinia striiformis f. sp. tritici]